MTLSEASSADDRLLVRYLLGHLSDAQAERFDRSSIEDDDFADRLRLIEQELVDGYVRRTLPAELMASVERHYAASPRRLHRIKNAEAFLDAIDRVAGPAEASEADAVEPGTPGSDRRRTFTRLLVLAAAIVVAVSAAVIVSRGAFGGRQNEPAMRAANGTAAPNPMSSQKASPLPATTAPRDPGRSRIRNIAAAVALVLPPQTRGFQSIPTMAAPAADRAVVIVVQLDADDGPYQATLKHPSSNRALWRDDWRWPSNYKDVLSLTVEIPQGLLKAQRYWLEVAGRRSTGQPEVVATYVFEVEQR
jgi:hypothetical protein